jgi:hypothetical protein
MAPLVLQSQSSASNRQPSKAAMQASGLLKPAVSRAIVAKTAPDDPGTSEQRPTFDEDEFPELFGKTYTDHWQFESASSESANAAFFKPVGAPAQVGAAGGTAGNGAIK